MAPQAASPGGTPGDLDQGLISSDYWTDDMVQAAGIPIRDVPLVTVGGGVGSFTLTDTLRVAGVPASAIAVLTSQDYPYQTYEYLTGNSQIPLHERIRSDSGSVLDNVWGWPGYAVREAFAARTVRGFIAPLLQVFVEPVFTEYYTPRLGDVFRSVDRERPRIGYDQMVHKGNVRMVRRRNGPGYTSGGGYFTILTPPEGTSPTRRVAFRSQYVHLAMGYPKIQFLPDLQEYRQRYQDYARVVNAYEPHDHVYQDLITSGGTVVLRGSGIVASRVLQRLTDDIETHGARTQILHLFRNYVSGPHGPSVTERRPGGDGFAYQGFNWPKGTWGGQQRELFEREDPEYRMRLFTYMGGTNTPKRRLWQQQLRRGRQAGWYRQFVGQVTEVMPGEGRTILSKVRTADGTIIDLTGNYIIDATGLEGDIKENRVYADLLEHGGATTNILGKLQVERHFEVRGTANGAGTLYAAGAPTLGSYYAGVDTFLGHQYAAQRICDDLARRGFCKKIGPTRSISQWWRWARRQPPE